IPRPGPLRSRSFGRRLGRPADAEGANDLPAVLGPWSRRGIEVALLGKRLRRHPGFERRRTKRYDAYDKRGQNNTAFHRSLRVWTPITCSPAEREPSGSAARSSRWITLDNEDNYLDLLFFRRRLRRLVAIELKMGKSQAADKG